jgi:hypothetical protein
LGAVRCGPCGLRIEVRLGIGLEPINQEGDGYGKATATSKGEANQDNTVNPMPRFLVPKDAKPKGDGKRWAHEHTDYSVNESFLIMCPFA